MKLGQRIAELRRKHNFTQEKLAEKCNVSRQAVTKWESGDSEPSLETLIHLADIFQVSIDELVRGNKLEIFEKRSLESDEIQYRDVEMAIRTLEAPFFADAWHTSPDFYASNSLSALTLLYNFIEYKYIDENEEVYEKYLIKNTTQKERETYIHLLNHDNYSTFKKYINGECEIDKALEAASKEIYKKHMQLLEIMDKKRESKENQIYCCVKKILNDIKNMHMYNETIQENMKEKQKDLLKRLHKDLCELDTESVLGMFFSLVEQEINTVCKNNDIDRAEKWKKVWECLQPWMWSQISFF